MLRKRTPLLAAVLALLLGAGYFLRPVTLDIDGEKYSIRNAITVGQSLHQAGIVIYTGDEVVPALNQPVPPGGIHVARAAQVTLWEDGQVRQVSGRERVPSALLAAAGVDLTGARVTWNGRPLDLDAPLPAGQALVLRVEHPRQVVIDDNGQRRQAATTAATAGAALWEAGVRIAPGDALSVPPDSMLDASAPAVMAIRAARALTIQAAGQSIQTRTTTATVGQALAEAGVALQGLDYAIPAEDQPLPQDGQVRIIRVREEISLNEEMLPFESQRVPDPDGEIDTTRVLKAGQYGVKVTRERARFEDGQEVSRAFDSDWIAQEPVAQTIGVGTKIVTKTIDAPGGAVEYWRAINVYATSYSPCRLGTGDGQCGYKTASGATLTKGIIAVTRAWYRIIGGLRVYVPGYGVGVIGDVGGGIPGRPWIDLGFDEDNFQGIVGWTTMYFLTPAPANTAWSLP